MLIIYTDIWSTHFAYNYAHPFSYPEWNGKMEVVVFGVLPVCNLDLATELGVVFMCSMCIPQTFSR